MLPEKLPIICGDENDRWCVRVDGKARWFTPIVQGEHDGYFNEQPIVDIDGASYRIGMSCATRLTQANTGSVNQAYHALKIAADRMGNAAMKAGRMVGTGNRRRLEYTITPEHKRVIKAMSDVLAGIITPDDAVGMLHEYDIQEQRLCGSAA